MYTCAHTYTINPFSIPVTSDSLSLDCEMVGGGHRGEVNMLARCSIVDCHGNIVYDTYVAPTAHVWDYRTFVSGIRRRDLVGGEGSCIHVHVTTHPAAVTGCILIYPWLIS